MYNVEKEKADQIARELQRASIALDQHRIDLRESEVENEILQLGLNQMIEKYREMARSTGCITVALICSNVIQDITNIQSVSKQTSEEILSKTQKINP